MAFHEKGFDGKLSTADYSAAHESALFLYRAGALQFFFHARCAPFSYCACVVYFISMFFTWSEGQKIWCTVAQHMSTLVVGSYNYMWGAQLLLDVTLFCVF